MGEVDEKLREEWSATQQEVWEGEETYWECVAAGDVEGFMALIDDQFVGWPTHENTPTTASELRSNVEDWVSEVQSFDKWRYTLQPFEIVTEDDIGITYYRSHKEYQDGDKTESRASEITHTWRNTGGEWKIRGGMGRESILED